MTDYRTFSLSDYAMNKKTAETIRLLIGAAVAAEQFDDETLDSLIWFSNHLFMKEKSLD